MAAAAAVIAAKAHIMGMSIPPISLAPSTAWWTASLAMQTGDAAKATERNSAEGTMIIMSKALTAEIAITGEMVRTPQQRERAQRTIDFLTRLLPTQPDWDKFTNELTLELDGSADDIAYNGAVRVVSSRRPPNQSPEEYVRVVCHVFEQSKVDAFTLLRAIVVQGLDSPELERVVRAGILRGEAKDIATLRKLITDSSRTIASPGVARPVPDQRSHGRGRGAGNRGPQGASVQRRTPAAHDDWGLKHELPAEVSATERRRRLADGLCLSCGQSGHVVKECPSRPAVRKTVGNV